MKAHIIEPEHYKLIFTKMLRDFLPNELPPLPNMKKNFSRNLWRGYFFTDSNIFVGYAIVAAPPDIPFALISYLAVEPSARSKGYGSYILNYLSEEYASYDLLVEVHDPFFAKTEQENMQCNRRIAFYESNGFHLLPTKKVVYFGIPMRIMIQRPDFIPDVAAMIHGIYSASMPPKLLEHIIIENSPAQEE